MASKAWDATMADFALWLALHGFLPETPFKGMSGKRRFRWDFANPAKMVAVEYQGRGVGHQSIAGTWRDHEKATEGQLCGWLVVLCNALTVKDGTCQTWVEIALRIRG